MLLVNGETDSPFPMISDAGTIGFELTSLEALAHLSALLPAVYLGMPFSDCN
jgi:hypothetical protein